MDITFAISTNRDYEQFLKPTLDHIYSLPKYGRTFEVLVYGPQTVNNDDRITRFFEEKHRQGNLFGYNYMTWEAAGETIVYVTDDMLYGNNLFQVHEKIQSMPTDIQIAGFNCGSQMYTPFPNGLIIPDEGFNQESVEKILKSKGTGRNIKIPCSRFIAASKYTIDHYLDGYIFHPCFFQGAGDLYLGIWLWYIHDFALTESLGIDVNIRIPASVTDYLYKDSEMLRNLINKLSLGYTSYV